MILNKDKVVDYLESTLGQEDIGKIKNRISSFKDNVKSTRMDKRGFLNISSNGAGIVILNNKLDYSSPL